MEDITRRALFGAGAGLGALAVAGAAGASVSSPDVRYLHATAELKTWTPPRHWIVTPELERRLSDDIADNTQRYRAQAEADLIVHTLGDGPRMLFTPAHEDGHALVEYMLRQGWLKTNDESSTDSAGVVLPYGYDFTDRARVEAAVLAAGEPERLSPQGKAQIGALVRSIDREDSAHYVSPDQLKTWHDSDLHQDALLAERGGVLKRVHQGFGAEIDGYVRHSDKAWVTVRYADGREEDVEEAKHRAFHTYWDLTEYGYWTALSRHWTHAVEPGAERHWIKL